MSKSDQSQQLSQSVKERLAKGGPTPEDCEFFQDQFVGMSKNIALIEPLVEKVDNLEREVKNKFDVLEERRKADRRASENRHDLNEERQTKSEHELSLLKHGFFSMQSDMNAGFMNLRESITSLFKNALDQKSQAKPSHKILDKVPVTVWPVVIISIIGAWVFHATGDDSLLRLIGLGNKGSQ